jgi:hypothetical protein
MVSRRFVISLTVIEIVDLLLPAPFSSVIREEQSFSRYGTILNWMHQIVHPEIQTNGEWWTIYFHTGYTERVRLCVDI